MLLPLFPLQLNIVGSIYVLRFVLVDELILCAYGILSYVMCVIEPRRQILTQFTQLRVVFGL